MVSSARALKSFARALSWNTTGRTQKTLAATVARSGTALHSGATTTARIVPGIAGEGRYFVSVANDVRIPAAAGYVVDSPLCTTLCRDGARVRTVEHLLSALEACGVDNCRIEIEGGDEVPLLDGSAKEWVEAIQEVGFCTAQDRNGHSLEKLAPELHEPFFLQRGHSFILALPSSKAHITYGIDFPQVPAIGSQWFSSCLDETVYCKEISSSRTFCIYEEVEEMQKSGLIQGGSTDNAIVCSVSSGWLNPPLRFSDEPCRHKVLDLVGDLSLLAQNGHQGFPLAHVIVFKGGHSLHSKFVKLLSRFLNTNKVVLYQPERLLQV